MKKFLLIATCAFALSATCTYAQDKDAIKAEKAARSNAEKLVKKAKSEYEMAIPNPQYGRKETNYEKAESARTLIEQALQDQYNADSYLAYQTAADIEYLFFTKAENAIKADPENEALKTPLIESAKKVVTYCVKYDELASNDPKVKDTEKKAGHVKYQQIAANPTLQCLMAAQNMSNKEGATVEDQKMAVELSNLVYNTFEKSSLMSDFSVKKSDPASYNDWVNYAKVFRAQPLLQIPGTTDEQIEEAFSALYDTKFKESAYLQVADYYRKNENKAKYEETLKKGMEANPENHAFANNLFNVYFQEKKFAEAKALAKEIIEKFPEDAADMHYKSGIINFNEDNLEEALNEFVAAYNISKDSDHLKNAAIASAQIVVKNESKDKAVIKKLEERAIDLLEQYKAADPSDSELWGSRLYILYNNTGNQAKAAQYKKYYK